MLNNILIKYEIALWLYTKFSFHYERVIDFLRRKLNDSIIAVNSLDPDYVDGDSGWREYRVMRKFGLTQELIERRSKTDREKLVNTINDLEPMIELFDRMSEKGEL